MSIFRCHAQSNFNSNFIVKLGFIFTGKIVFKFSGQINHEQY